MEDAFFSQLDGNAVRELLLRTELRHAALFAVSDTLRIERCSDAAQQLSGLHPMEELDPFLSGSTRNILLRCINTQSACTAEEDIDGTVYTVEMIPHRGGALLAYLRRDRAAYDGSLRVIQDKSSRYLGALMAEAEQVEDPALADGLRRQCMRLYRLLTHSDLLHDPLLTEQLSLRRCDLSALCRDAVQQAETHAPAGSAKFIVQVPEHADALIDARLVRTAIYNLLTNALRATPEDGEITVSLTDTRDFVTIAVADTGPGLERLVRTAIYNLLTNALRATPEDGEITVSLTDTRDFVTIAVADTGPGLDPAKFDDLLSGWRRTTSIDDYRALVRGGTPLGLGLPLVNQIAQAHGGRLLLTQREGGGSVLHLCLAHLPHTLEDDLFRAPTIIEDGYTAEEIEFSILE